VTTNTALPRWHGRAQWLLTFSSSSQPPSKNSVARESLVIRSRMTISPVSLGLTQQPCQHLGQKRWLGTFTRLGRMHHRDWRTLCTNLAYLPTMGNGSNYSGKRGRYECTFQNLFLDPGGIDRHHAIGSGG